MLNYLYNLSMLQLFIYNYSQSPCLALPSSELHDDNVLRYLATGLSLLAFQLYTCYFTKHCHRTFFYATLLYKIRESFLSGLANRLFKMAEIHICPQAVKPHILGRQCERKIDQNQNQNLIYPYFSVLLLFRFCGSPLAKNKF